MTVLRNG